MEKTYAEAFESCSIKMGERVENQPISDRLFCPNCPADYPTPFSRRHISCRRCGTEFLAPDEARESVRAPADLHRLAADEDADETPDEQTEYRYLRAIQTSAPSIALSFNGAAFCFWFAGIVSFEIAVMTILLVMNGLIVQERL